MLSVMSLSSSTTSILFFLELLLVDLDVSWFFRIGGVVAIIMSTSYRSGRYTVVCNWLLLFVSSAKYIFFCRKTCLFHGWSQPSGNSPRLVKSTLPIHRVLCFFSIHSLWSAGSTSRPI